jgi:nucleoside-diphosphate kinase
MPTEETLVLVKPDGVARGLTGAILAHRGQGLRPGRHQARRARPRRARAALRRARGQALLRAASRVHALGPSVAIRLAGNRVIEGFRSLAGTTDPTTAAPGTIRGDFGRDWGLKVQQNLVHGSDSPESAARELAIWF